MKTKYFAPEHAITAAKAEGENSSYKIAHKEVDIAVPIELRPYTDVGDIKINYCGNPKIECTHEPCENGLYIMIKQKAKITIPVNFDVNAAVKDSFVRCVN